MDDQAQETSLEPELSWSDLPECVRKALDQDLRRPSPEILTNLFSDKDDVASFVESLGLNMGSAEWLSACEILEKVCAEASQGADRVLKARAVQGQLAQASSSSSLGPQPQPLEGWADFRVALLGADGRPLKASLSSACPSGPRSQRVPTNSLCRSWERGGYVAYIG